MINCSGKSVRKLREELKMMVSVIIPVYNVSEYIERCIRSVMTQTFTDIECIIVDDATEDDSIEKCERLIEEYNHNLDLNLNERGRIRFKILYHEVNRGLSAARNTGTEAATGDWIFYLDSDDEITPNCIEKLVTIAQEHPDVDMVQGNSMMIPNDIRIRVHVDRRIPEHLSSNGEIVRYYHKHWIPTSAWNKLVKCSFLKDNDLAFKEGLVYEDLLWMFYVMKDLEKICVCKDITYHYYVRSGSIMKATEEKISGKSYYCIYNDILTSLTPGRERDELDCYVEGFCNQYMRYKSAVPDFYSLYMSYVEKTKKYRCRLSQTKLMVADMMENVPFGINMLQVMKDVKTILKG